MATELTQEIGSRITAITEDTRETIFPVAYQDLRPLGAVVKFAALQRRSEGCDGAGRKLESLFKV